VHKIIEGINTCEGGVEFVQDADGNYSAKVTFTGALERSDELVSMQAVVNDVDNFANIQKGITTVYSQGAKDLFDCDILAEQKIRTKRLRAQIDMLARQRKFFLYLFAYGCVYVSI
jgi:hypothetical protein